MKLIILVLMLTLPSLSFAKKASTPSGKDKLAATKPKGLSTQVNFDDATLYGRYNSADEGFATVEDDKAMGLLLGLRMDFKDRLKKSAELK